MSRPAERKDSGETSWKTMFKQSKFYKTQLLLISYFLKIIFNLIVYTVSNSNRWNAFRFRANRFLAAKAGVREGSAAQDRTCISILHIHTYLSIYIYFYIDRYATIPFLLSLQGDSGLPASHTQAPGDCRRLASSHSSKDGGENLAKS